MLSLVIILFSINASKQKSIHIRAVSMRDFVAPVMEMDCVKSKTVYSRRLARFNREKHGKAKHRKKYWKKAFSRLKKKK